MFIAKQRSNHYRRQCKLDANSRTISQSWPTLRSYHENITLILFLYLCFKVGMREEWKVAFPTHRLKGCSFHFNQVFINDDGITCDLHHLESSNRFHSNSIQNRLCSGKCRTRARHNCTVRHLCLERHLGELYGWRLAFSLPFVPLERLIFRLCDDIFLTT